MNSRMAARSPVFAVMFKHPSKEKLAGIVNVPDIEPDVFKVLLRYIYIGQVPLQRMDKLAIGLLAAADKYLLEKLKKACRDHLVKNIKIKIVTMEMLCISIYCVVQKYTIPW